MQTMSSKIPWHANLPSPRAVPLQLAVSELRSTMDDPSKRAGVDYVVVDVRRADMDVSHSRLLDYHTGSITYPFDPQEQEADGKMIIPGAINLPAQTFHQTLPTLIAILSRSVEYAVVLRIFSQFTQVLHYWCRIPRVIFHCSSSNGRGPRCAGWYQDALNQDKITSSKAYVLTGGIKAWKEAHPEDLRPL